MHIACLPLGTWKDNWEKPSLKSRLRKMATPISTSFQSHSQTETEI